MTFLDTNILLYAIGYDDDDRKRLIAVECLPGAGVSVQAIAEMTNRLSLGRQRSRRAPSSWDRIQDAITDISSVLSSIVPLSADHQVRARQIARTAKLSYYDAQMIAVAAANRADTLLTEDMNHDQTVEGVRLVNPFR